MVDIEIKIILNAAYEFRNDNRGQSKFKNSELKMHY